MISLFGFAPDVGELPGPLHWIDGVAHCIPPASGGAWCACRTASSWSGRPAGRSGRTSTCPTCWSSPSGDLPDLIFDGRAVFGSAHWKLDAIDEYAGDRPAAWIDDNIDDDCRAWADVRARPPR